MDSKLRLSVQTGDWYDELFGADEGADEAFRFIKECGFDVLDYNIDHQLSVRSLIKGEMTDYFDVSDEEFVARFVTVKEAMKRQGISMGQAHAPFPLYVEGREDINDFLIKVVEKQCALCQFLECPALVVHPYTNPADKEEEKRINLEMYRKMIPAGKKYGVTLCLENMFAWFNGHATLGACGEAAEACWYIDTLNAEAGQDIFGYCFDVGHANLCSRNIRQELQTLGHRLTILHIHDNDGQSDQHQMPYAGKVGTDWQGFMDGLKDIQYEGTLNFETFASLKGGIPQELFGAKLKFLHEVGVYFQKKINEA